MHGRERTHMILRLVQERSVVAVRELIALSGASGATIRRDLAELAEAGLIRRVHGGVEAVDPAHPRQLETRGFAAARSLNVARKRAIARQAAALCRDGESIIINAGSTTFEMVEPLMRRRLHILTNSFPIAQALLERSENRIVLPGGELYRQQGIIVSPFDDDAIQHYTAARMFMSCYSVGAMGVIEGDPLIARAEAKLLRRADQLVLLVDSSKFDPRGSIVVCPLTRVSTVITDDAAPAAALDMLRAAGIEVMVAPVDEEEVRARVSAA
jgi:DeoR family transcriptional regulator, ulaG and ulaABCDEF operon transcriptional repressor